MYTRKQNYSNLSSSGHAFENCYFYECTLKKLSEENNFFSWFPFISKIK
jgi:hypothetical protein